MSYHQPRHDQEIVKLKQQMEVAVVRENETKELLKESQDEWDIERTGLKQLQQSRKRVGEMNDQQVIKGKVSREQIRDLEATLQKQTEDQKEVNALKQRAQELAVQLDALKKISSQKIRMLEEKWEKEAHGQMIIEQRKFEQQIKDVKAQQIMEGNKLREQFREREVKLREEVENNRTTRSDQEKRWEGRKWNYGFRTWPLPSMMRAGWFKSCGSSSCTHATSI